VLGSIRRFGPASTTVLLLQLACSSGVLETKGAPSASHEASTSHIDQFVSSNILRSDYVGSNVCGECHAEIFERWSRSPMHRMTRIPKDADIRTPFSGSVEFKEDRAQLEEHDGARFMRVLSPRFGNHLYRVTRVIGGRYREDFAGVEVERAAPNAPVIGDPKRELILPLTWVYSTQSFRLKAYSVMVRERPGLRAGGVWNRTCILCHNTAPLLTGLLGSLAAPGDRESYQGAAVDDLLPADRRAAYRVIDSRSSDRALWAELEFLGGDHADGIGQTLLRRTIRATRNRFGAEHLVELGIGCEACHGGSREHAANPGRSPTFAPVSPFLRMRAGSERGLSQAELINRSCARCHQILFSRYPYTWEGGERRHSPGGSSISSGEARDLMLGACHSQLTCTLCHDPHAEDDAGALAQLETPSGNRVCTGCHATLAEESALRGHAHHDPTGGGGSCIGCHMPKKNMGLGYALTRYHRIGSPTDRARVEEDRPLECALCHADKSAEELLHAIERLWGKTYDERKLRALYGDLSEPVLVSTLRRGKPHEQAAAIGVLQTHPIEAAFPLLVEALAHPYPLVRYYSRTALEQGLGRAVTIDVGMDAAEIKRHAALILAR
jgi:predicted CXXCH cytochrome family protein